jgi:hypothetical protein
MSSDPRQEQNYDKHKVGLVHTTLFIIHTIGETEVEDREVENR